MTSPFRAISLRLCLCAAALVLLPAIEANVSYPSRYTRALAEPGVTEKEAFETAKGLGTIDAWDAFLKSYPSGFHADMARAYVKKLDAGEPAAAPATAPAASAPGEFPAEAGSWGGIVRDGPGQDHRKLDSLEEGERIALMGRSDVVVDGYPWFKIWYRGERKGYMWGGILCSVGAERPDLYKTCPAEPRKSETNKRETEKPKKTAKKKKTCPKGMYLNQLGACQPNETGG